MTLRSKIIRLAHSRPDLRSDLLPLLKTSSFKWEKDSDGQTLELDKGKKLVVIPMDGPRKTRKKSEKPKNVYAILVVGKGWRQGDYLNDKGVQTDERFDFETEDEAKKVAEAFASKQSR